MEDDLAVVVELWSPCPGVKVDEKDLCSELIGLAACLSGHKTLSCYTLKVDSLRRRRCWCTSYRSCLLLCSTSGRTSAIHTGCAAMFGM